MNTYSRVLATMMWLPALAVAQEAKPKAEPKAEPKPAAVSKEEARRAEEMFDEGRKLYFQGDHLGAVAKLVKAAETDPAKIGYRMLLAKAYRRSSQDAKAQAILEDILKADPDHVDAGVELSEMLSPVKQPDRVIAVLTPLLRYKHDYPLFHLLGEAHLRKEQLDQARKYFAEAVQLNPSAADDHYRLGGIHLAQKRFAKAIESYEAAGRLGVTGPVYHYQLAGAHFNLRNYLGTITSVTVVGAKAGDIRNDLLLLDPVPGHKDSFYAAGPKSAVFQAAKARSLGLDGFEVRFLEANIRLGARRYAEADAFYKAMQDKLRKEDAGFFWFQWAQAALGLDDFDAYLTRLQKAAAAEPEAYKSAVADAFVTIAVRRHQRGDVAGHLDYLGKAVAANPLSSRLHLLLGDAQWAAGNKDKAVEQYRLVLELEPDHAQRVRLLNRIRGPETPVGA